ncbi:MAG: hypothetical protein M3Z04_14730, partial [Chloroflexota bacterium]|nr:hypothetical protein [Chloroflexota bacterium]
QVRYYYDRAGADANQAYRRVRAKRLLDGLDDTINTVHNVPYFYEYRGATLNTVSQSQEANGNNPLHAPETEFRGFSWVRQFDPMNTVTDHAFSQDDGNVGQAWRVQAGKTVSMTDPLTAAPTSTPEALLWTTSDVVIGTPPERNPAWQISSLSNLGSMTRTGGVADGSDVSLRLLVQPQTSPASFVARWTMTNPSTPGEYWGLEIHSVADTTEAGSFVLQPRIVWSLLQPDQTWATGTRDLDRRSPIYPHRFNPLSTGTWYRLQLHSGLDGRFAVELYNDKTEGDYLSIKSGDPADSGSIPGTRSGQSWRFTHEISQNNTITNPGWRTYAADYSETRTVYNEADTVYGDKPHAAPASGSGSTWEVGSGNNVESMTIRFRPVVAESSATLGGWAVQPDQARRTRKTYDYDGYGNQNVVYDEGDLAVTGDDRSMYTDYLTDTDHWIMDKPQQVSTYQGTSTLLAQQRFYYDGKPYGQLAGKGDLTKQAQINMTAGQPSSDTQFSYDSYGNPTQTLDPNGHGPTTSYDPYYQTFPVQVDYPNGSHTTTAYDYTLDAPTVLTDVNNTVTQRRYDALGRPARTWTVGYGSDSAPNERYSFPDLNPTAELSVPFSITLTRLTGTGSTTTWARRWFDGRGRTVEDVTPRDGSSQIVATTGYTMTGQVYTATLPYSVPLNSIYSPPDPTKPQLTRYYEGLGRPSQVVNPDGTSLTYDYQWIGWVASTDEVGHVKWQHSDALGRLDAVREQASVAPITTGYSYDLLDRLLVVTRDQGGSLATTATMTYDGLGRKATMQDPDMGAWSYGYDPAGNLISQQDALYSSNPSGYPDHQVLFAYDSMNRPTAKYYGQAHKNTNVADVKYYYDNALGDGANSWGKLRAAEVTLQGQGSNANGHSYVYDPRGLMLAEGVTTTVTTRVYTTTYSFDIGGRPSTLTYPDSTTAPEVVTLGYNTQGPGLPASLTSNVSGNPAPVANATYNERAQLLTLVQGVGPVPPYNSSNLLTSSFSYDDTTTQRGWLTNITVASDSGTHLNETLGYTANGNIAAVAQSAGGDNSPTFSNSFTYDGLDRLITAVSTGTPQPLYANESYSFDTLGRMTSRTVGGTTRPYSYSATHPDAPSIYNGTSYTYDANGSQVSTSAGQSRTFDPEGRLSSVSAGTSVSTYIYDANGQRLLTSVTAGGTTRRTLYIGGLYEEQLGSGSINYYSFGGKGVGLRRSGWPSGNGQYRLVGDHLGSTTLLVDTATPPTVVQRQYHKPYGEIAFQWTLGGSSLTSVGFTGQRLDTDTGLMYYGARFYDAVLGYFVSADPIGIDKKLAQSRNRYAYVGNNPLSYVDPSGNTRAVPDTSWENEHDYLMSQLTENGINPVNGDATWTDDQLWRVLNGVRQMRHAFGWSADEFMFAMGISTQNPLTITRNHTYFDPVCNCSVINRTAGTYTDGHIEFYDSAFNAYNSANDPKIGYYDPASATTIHELAHLMDIRSNYKYSSHLMDATHSTYDGNKYKLGGERSSSVYPINEKEDWAESVAATVLGLDNIYSRRYYAPDQARQDSVLWAVQDIDARYRQPTAFPLPPHP